MDLQHQFLVIGNVADINELLSTSWHENNTTRDTAAGQPGWIHAILITDPHNRERLADTGDVPISSICVDESFSNEDFVATAAGYNCDAVWVASLADFGHRNLRRLSWHLDRLNMRLYLDPMIEGIAGTRLNVVPFGPSHTLYVDRPRFNAANGLAKRFFDIALSAFALVAISPILAITAMAGYFFLRRVDRPWRWQVQNRLGPFLWLFLLWSALWTLAAQFFPWNNADYTLLHLVEVPLDPSYGPWFIYALALYYAAVKLMRPLPLWLQFSIGAVVSLPVAFDWITVDNFAWERTLTHFLIFQFGVYGHRIIAAVAERASVLSLLAVGGAWAVGIVAVTLTGISLSSVCC